MQKQTTQINSIDRSDNYKEQKTIKSALLKEQGITHTKAKDVLLFKQTTGNEKELE